MNNRTHEEILNAENVVLSYIRTHPNKSMSDIDYALIRMNMWAIRKAIESLMARGEVYKAGSGKSVCYTFSGKTDHE